jgi:hypothetical protein
LLGIDVAAVDRPGFAWVQAVSVDPASLATDRSPDDPADSAALGVIDFLAEPWIALLDRELTEVDGDGDPFPDPGETWSLRVQLANRGTVAGEPTRGTLSASSADLTVDSPSLSFGDVAAGGQAWSAETATLLIDPGADTTVVHEVSLAVDAGGVAAQLAVPLTLGPRPTDKAEDAALMGESGSWIGDLSVTTDDWRDTAGCTGSVAAGRDGVYLLELDAGQVVTAHVVYAAGVQDAVLYIGTDLADPAGTCLTGADDRDDETETLFWTAPAQGSYLLLVDGLHEDFGGEYVLTLSL